MPSSTILERREFVRTALTGVSAAIGGAFAAGGGAGFAQDSTEVGIEASPAVATPASRNVLLVFFSRPGENYFYGDRIDLDIGNTKVLAGMIGERIQCETYEIEADDPYGDSYDETVERNVREQEADARPGIANPLPSLDGYDTVLLGSPIWNVRPPMIMSTFAERFDFTGKTVFPFVTYAVSGLGRTVRVYEEACAGAAFGEGLAVRGEEVQDAGSAVDAWLERIGLAAS